MTAAQKAMVVKCQRTGSAIKQNPRTFSVFSTLFLRLAIFAAFILASDTIADSPPWIGGHSISPSITYQYRVEQRSGFHQQIHRVQIDLRGENVSIGLSPAAEFPRHKSLPSEMRKRLKSQVVVPAPLAVQTRAGREMPLGRFLAPNTYYLGRGGFPEVRIRPLNNVIFYRGGEDDTVPPRLALESSGTLTLAGFNTPPTEPGIYLYQKSFSPISARELADWKVSACYWLERVLSSSEPDVYRVRKSASAPSSLTIPENNLLILDVMAGNERLSEFLAAGRHVRVMAEETELRKLIRGVFCSGPYFMYEGVYDEEAVRAFCNKPGAPPVSQYTERRARLALAIGSNRRFLYIYAVDQNGFTREGMTLREFAVFLAEEGVKEAMELPDGDDASLALPYGQVNTTPDGIEMPVMAVLTVTERSPDKDEIVNLLRSVPNMVTACGSEPLNPPDAVKDGSYSQALSLDNYWEHKQPDPFHKHALYIDLLKPCELRSLEIFYAEEAGFSSQYNWRAFTIYGHDKDKNSMRKVMEVRNPDGRPCQWVEFPPATKLRYLKIEVEQPTGFKDVSCARLAEIVLWGR